MRQGPLAGRYSAVATMVMFALIPIWRYPRHSVR